MLAEQASSTELRLPQEFRDQAKALGGELAWTASVALKAVSWLASEQCAVVGVELWRDKEGQPFWVATSDYSPTIRDVITSKEIARCARKAGGFIQAHRYEPNVLFNLTWLEPTSKKTC